MKFLSINKCIIFIPLRQQGMISFGLLLHHRFHHEQHYQTVLYMFYKYLLLHDVAHELELIIFIIYN